MDTHDPARLAYARKCVKLAKSELREFKREFARGQETVYDWAVDYGRSARITREEVIAAMAPTRTIVDDIKLVVGEWFRERGYRTGDPTVPADCGLDVFTALGEWICTLSFTECGVRPSHLTYTGNFSRTTKHMLFEYADPRFLDLVNQYVESRLIRCEGPI